MNALNKDKFYEKETPVYVKIKGGEIRFYREAHRIAFSKNMWIDANGCEQVGKTVTYNLAFNRGNEEFIAVLEEVLADLKATAPEQEGGADNGGY